jgi:hypothetical protein
MQFLNRNRYALVTIAVLIFSSVMVVQQYLTNQSAHTRQVEDFLLLHERAEKIACDHLYQLLVQQLPHLNDRALVQDLQRTAMVVDGKTPQLDNLVWKYHVGVNNELKRRAEKRLEIALQGAAKE